MASETKTLNTVEDLVALASRPYGNDARWELQEWGSRTWDNPDAGSAWLLEETTLRQAFKQQHPDGIWYDSEISREHEARRPSDHPYTRWYLSRSIGSWRSSTIDLSEELGKQIDAVWTKKPAWRGATHTKRTGLLTLPGICKRLGRTDVADRVKAAKKAEEEKAARNRRNYARRDVIDVAKKLQEALTKARLADVDASFDIDNPLSDLIAAVTNGMETDDAA